MSLKKLFSRRKRHANIKHRLLDATKKNDAQVLEAALEDMGDGAWDKGLTTVLGLCLSQSLSKGHVECLRLLLKAGVSPDGLASDVVMAAVQKGEANALRLLLQSGLDVALRGDGDNTMLHVAVCGKVYYDCVRSLMEHRADPTVRNEQLESPLTLAMEAGDEELISILLRHPEVKMHHDTDGRNMLHLACRKGMENLVSHMLEQGWDADVKDANQHTPLIDAVLRRHIPIVQCLANKCDINFPGQRYATALIYAAQTNEVGCLKILIDAGARPNHQDVMGNTALIAGGPYKDIITLLLASGANPDIQNHFGMTALWYAAYYHFLDIVELLLQAGSDPELKGVMDDEFHTSPIEISLKRGHFSIAKMMIFFGCNNKKLADFMKSSGLPQAFYNSTQGLELLEWTKEWTCNPRSLKYLCRKSIRNSIQDKGVQMSLAELPLPKSIIQFLQFDNLKDVI